MINNVGHAVIGCDSRNGNESFDGRFEHIFIRGAFKDDRNRSRGRRPNERKDIRIVLARLEFIRRRIKFPLFNFARAHDVVPCRIGKLWRGIVGETNFVSNNGIENSD